MKIGITGAQGLLGYHVRAGIQAFGSATEVRLATRDTFADPELLDCFTSGLDAVIHCAGVNRGEEGAVRSANPTIALALVASMERTGAKPAIAYANSTHQERQTAYGIGKREAAEILEAWGGRTGVPIGNFVLPHVFGEFGKPFYNSVVSTFCHQLVVGDTPSIDVDGQLELIHAQDVARIFEAWIKNATTETRRVEGRAMRVSEMLTTIRTQLDRYQSGVLPDLTDILHLRLFNTLRSYLYPQHYPRKLKLHEDARGSLFEAVKTDQGGQGFVSTTLPGITRGNHWHLNKIERFLVVGGQAVIRIRKLFSNEVNSFEVSGDQPAYIDIPTLHTHSITNTGSGALQTLFWSNEIFDPNNPDTYPEAVQP